MTAVAFAASTGVAQAACPTPNTSQPFAEFGDNADYVLVPGGAFESGMAGWSHSGTAVIPGNEPFQVRDAGDDQMLHVTPNGESTSPAFCVDATYPTLRLFARHFASLDGALSVDLLWRDAAGRTGVAHAGTLHSRDFGAWNPSRSLPLATVLPVASGDLSVRIRLSGGGSAVWSVDNVYADPWRAG